MSGPALRARRRGGLAPSRGRRGSQWSSGGPVPREPGRNSPVLLPARSSRPSMARFPENRAGTLRASGGVVLREPRPPPGPGNARKYPRAVRTRLAHPRPGAPSCCWGPSGPRRHRHAPTTRDATRATTNACFTGGGDEVGDGRKIHQRKKPPPSRRGALVRWPRIRPWRAEGTFGSFGDFPRVVVLGKKSGATNTPQS